MSFQELLYYFLEQRNLENMREVEKKDVAKAAAPKESNKTSYEDQKKGKGLQNKLSKVESQIKQLEKDIQHDDKMLASNYDKHIEDASFFYSLQQKESRFRPIASGLGNRSGRN